MRRLARLKSSYQRHGLVTLGRLALKNKHRALDFLASPSRHFYSLELPVFWEDVVTVVPSIVNSSRDDIARVWNEITTAEKFTSSIETRLRETAERPDELHSNWRELLYVFVRLRQPSLVIETGVHDGLSSAYILQALQKCGGGTLVSIDINDKTRLPSDLNDPNAGWLIPDSLKEHWNCRYERAEDCLPSLMEEQPPEIFLHDSLHTAEHMAFEFECAVEHMSPGDLILTDNSRFNSVFRDVSKNSFERTAFWKNTKYALSPEKERVDDRFGVGVLS